MRRLVLVVIVSGVCGPAFAGSSDIGAPWAGSLIIPAKAEVGATSLNPPPAQLVPSLKADKPAAATNQSVVPQSTHANKKKAVLSGYASFYDFGRITANGERFLPMGMTAAHRTLPFGTKLLVTNKKTGKSILVRINDRGPFIRGRVIDLTRGAARAIGLEGSGLASVTMEVQ